jgi:transglutaminase-like putative cysteine protease
MALAASAAASSAALAFALDKWRFVSGYLHTPPSMDNFGATHAWAEVYLPGAGWKGFDPTIGEIVGTNHIAVAVARLPESVPPIAGLFVGPPGANLIVGVWVTEM